MLEKLINIIYINFLLILILVANFKVTYNTDIIKVKLSDIEISDFYTSFETIYGVKVNKQIPIYWSSDIHRKTSALAYFYAKRDDNSNLKYIVVDKKFKSNKYVIHHEIFHYLMYDSVFKNYIDNIPFTKYVTSDSFKETFSPFIIREFFYNYHGTIVDVLKLKEAKFYQENVVNTYADSFKNEEMAIRILMNNFIYHPLYINNFPVTGKDRVNKLTNILLITSIFYNYQVDYFYKDYGIQILDLIKSKQKLI